MAHVIDKDGNLTEGLLLTPEEVEMLASIAKVISGNLTYLSDRQAKAVATAVLSGYKLVERDVPHCDEEVLTPAESSAAVQ